MTVARTRGRSAGLSIAPQTKKVEVLNVLNGMATVRDGFGVTHQVRLDLLRYKGDPPSVGEVWYIDRSLGPWAFQAVVVRANTQSLVAKRKTATYRTSDDLGVEETEVGTIEMATGYRVLTVATSQPARVRLYPTTLDQDVDLERPTNADPAPGTGIVMDFLTADTLLTAALSPIPEGANLNDVPDGHIPISVTSVIGGPVIVTLTWVATE